jgi:hypothetical protein
MPDVVVRAARMAHAFCLANLAVIVGLARLLKRREVWR